MQENNFSEFDQQIRMMLEGASEVAPARSWSAINRKLKHRRAAILWRRVGYGVALAAFGLAFVLPGFMGKNGGDRMQSPVVAEEQISIIPAAEGAAPDFTAVAAAHDFNAPATAPEFSAPASAPETDGRFFPEVEEERENVAETIDGRSSGNVSVSEKQKTEKTDVTEPAETDPFRRMEMEDALARRNKPGRTSLDLKGILSSNDNIKRPVFTGKYGSPASFKTSSGEARVYENSDVSYDIPVSFGLGMRFALSEKISVGTGISYSRLGRSFSGHFDSVPFDKIVHTVQYVGIPLNVYYNVLKFDGLDFYCFAGAEAEKNVSNRYKVGSGKNAQIYDDKAKGLQWSVAGGIGLEYHLADKFGIYFDPSARYFFDCGQPVSIRTKKPFQFSFEAGFRFDL